VTTHNVALTVKDNNAVKVYIKNCIMSECGNFAVTNTDYGTAIIAIDDSLIDNLSSQTNRTGLTVTKDADTLDIDAGNSPGFVDVTNTNLALTAVSAAMNLGDNAWLTNTYQGAILGLPYAQQTDFAGTPRVSQSKCEAGAYEFKSSGGTVFMFK
jgi:hypothetical protein